MRQRLFFNRHIGKTSDDPMCDREPYKTYQACSEDVATVVTSIDARDSVWTDTHLPTLDIDLPCELRESSPGKFHLYIDAPMPWAKYRMLLDVLAQVGIIEHGYADASIAKGGSALRKPGTFKNVTIYRETAHTYNPQTHTLIPKDIGNAINAAVAELTAAGNAKAFNPQPDVTVPKADLVPANTRAWVRDDEMGRPIW